jgi:hypothetical protein
VSERPDRDPFEDELRRALRAERDRVDDPAADRVLERIHQRVGRRRVHRRYGAFVATAAMLAAIAVVVPLIGPTTPVDQATDVPRLGRSADDPRRDTDAFEVETVRPPSDMRADREPLRTMQTVPMPRTVGAPVTADNVQVSSVTGAGSGEFYLSASATCGRHTCNVLGHADQSGSPRFTVLPGSARLAHTVRFSGDGQVGWATNGIATFRTDDGGEDWTRLRQPAGVEVQALEAWGDQVWAMGSKGAEPVVLNEVVSGNALQELDPPGALTPEPELTVALGEDAFGATLIGPGSKFAYTTDGGVQWSSSDIGCKPVDLSATLDAVWALCDDPTPTLVRSLNQGRTWDQPESFTNMVAPDAATTVAAVSADAAFVASGSRGWVVESSVASPAIGLGDGPYVYAGFTTESVGYVIDGDGDLCRTEDGGRSWSAVDLP